jgi:hypothetical protein
LHCNIEDLEELLSLEDQKVIQWKFVPIGANVNIEPLSEDEQELSQVVNRNCGQKTQQLLPHLIAYLRIAGGWAKPYLRAKFDRSMFGIGGSKILVGHPVVPVYLLDSLATSELLIIPHIAATRPNGIWHIERGEQHPLVLAASKLAIWCLTNDEGHPDFICNPGVTDRLNQAIP